MLDAGDLPPTIPFWLGEAPGRSDELSASVSRLRNEIEVHLEHGIEATTAWLAAEARIATGVLRKLQPIVIRFIARLRPPSCAWR